MAMDQNPNRTPSEHPNPTTKIGSKMGGEFTYPKRCTTNQNGIRLDWTSQIPEISGCSAGGGSFMKKLFTNPERRRHADTPTRVRRFGGRLLEYGHCGVRLSHMPWDGAAPERRLGACSAWVLGGCCWGYLCVLVLDQSFLEYPRCRPGFPCFSPVPLCGSPNFLSKGPELLVPRE